MGTLRALVSGSVICYLASVLAGCAAYGSRPKSPAQGGSAWVEATSPRFRVVSDLPSEEAEAIARELEQGVEAIEQVAFEHARSRLEQTTVIVFQSASDFHAFMPDRVDGRFYRRLPGDLEPSSVLVLYGSLDESSRITCLHELTHDLFDLNFGPAPPWLGEGWAQYFSTIELEPDRIRVGAALPHLTFTQDAQPVMARAEDGSRVLAMPVHLVTPPSQLLGMHREAFYSAALKQSEEGTALYLGAWALVHLLHDGPEPYPTRFKRFMEASRHSPLETAWQSAFAGLSRAEFDHDFRVYLAKRELATFEYKRHATRSPFTVSKRALSDLEVRLYWARLSDAAESDAQPSNDLNAAITADKSSPEAHYFRGVHRLHQKQLAAAESDFLEAARLAPNDPRYLLGVLIIRIEQAQTSSSVHAAIGDPVMLAAERLAPVAASAMQLRVLALLYDDSGQLERALAFAQRAVARAPIDSWCLDAEARVLSHLGRTQEALEIQRAAVAFVPESADAPELVERLHSLEAAAR